jgi:hypothetical protein
MYRQCQYRWQVAKRRAWLLWRNFMGLEAFDAASLESVGPRVGLRRRPQPDAFAIPAPLFK